MKNSSSILKHIKHIKKKSIVKGNPSQKWEIEWKSNSIAKIVNTSINIKKEEKFELSQKTKKIIEKIK